MTLKNLDAGPFKVGDRVTGTVASLKGERATVIDRGRTWVRVQMDSRPDDVRYYLPSDLVHLDETESDLPAADAEDMDTKTVTRVVAVFQDNEDRGIDMSFTDASEADMWIDYLKTAPGRTTVTVTRNTTETFTRDNAWGKETTCLTRRSEM